MDILELETAISAYVSLENRKPAAPEALARMEIIAPLPAQLRHLYTRHASLYVAGCELFEPAIYEDVNTDKDTFGHLQDMVFFADDQQSGFYFLDPVDLLGLGEEAVYWVDRGMMEVDAVVPLADDLSGFLNWARSGVSASGLPNLGARALNRLRDLLKVVPADLQIGPPVQAAAFRKARDEKDVFLTYSTGQILSLANGMLFVNSGRTIYPLDQITSIAGGYVALIGHDPNLGHLGVTLGGWQDLPPDRLISFRDETQPENGQVLGRMADVLAFWISEGQT